MRSSQHEQPLQPTARVREGWWLGAWLGLVASGAAPETAAAEPYCLTACGWLLRVQVSRDAPPPLPGGYKVGEKVFFTGASETFPSGDKIMHGQQGEVVGPATSETHKGKGVSVLFPGNKDSVQCLLTEVRRLRASAPPPSFSWASTCAGEPRSAAATAGRLHGG